MFRCVLSELFTDEPGGEVEFYLDLPFEDAWKQLGEMMDDSSFTRGTMFNEQDDVVYDCFSDVGGVVQGSFGPLDFPDDVK